MKSWRQGDVVIKAATTEQLKDEKKDGVLAEGEMTGHAHRIAKSDAAKVYYTTVQGILAMKVLHDMCTITHEEHDDIVLPKGDYIVEVQREYDWMNRVQRRVAD